MVAMKMADKDMVDLSKPDTVFSKLQLRSLSAVDQKITLMRIEHMSGEISF
jgi:uncharacterized protein (UPF0261 family)